MTKGKRLTRGDDRLCLIYLARLTQNYWEQNYKMRSVILHRQEESCMSQHNNQNKPSPPFKDERCTPRTLGRAVLPIQSTEVECHPQGGALYWLRTSRGGHSQEPLYLGFPDTLFHSSTCPCLVPEGWSNATLLPSLPSIHSLCWYLYSSLYHPTGPFPSSAICLSPWKKICPQAVAWKALLTAVSLSLGEPIPELFVKGIEDPCAHLATIRGAGGSVTEGPGPLWTRRVGSSV